MSRLKGKMPRVLTNHRSATGKLLRRQYDAITERFGQYDADAKCCVLRDDISRQVAILLAQAWLNYQQASQSLDKLQDGKRMVKAKAEQRAIEIRRAKRLLRVSGGQYLGAYTSLAEIVKGTKHNGHEIDPLDLLMREP